MSVQTISTKKFSQMSRHFNGIVSVSESNLKPSSSEIYNQPPACLSISSHLNNRRTCRRGQTRRTWGQGEGGYEKMPPDNFQEFLALFKTGTAPSPTPLLKLLMMMSVLRRRVVGFLFYLLKFVVGQHFTVILSAFETTTKIVRKIIFSGLERKN